MLRNIHISVIETTPKSQFDDFHSTNLTLIAWHYLYVGCRWKRHLRQLCVLLPQSPSQHQISVAEPWCERRGGQNGS